MVIYRPGRLPERGVVRYEGGPFDAIKVSAPWPLPERIEPLTDVGIPRPGSYRRTSYSEEPGRLTATYVWEFDV